MMEAIGASETSVYSHETTRHYTPVGSHLHTRHRENLKSHRINYNYFLLLLKLRDLRVSFVW